MADATQSLADAWPWSRLRADPAVVDVPGPLPDARVVAWMDDGMWARWLLAAFPALGDLVDAACSLLAPNLARAARQVVQASIGRAAHTGRPGPMRSERVASTSERANDREQWWTNHRQPRYERDFRLEIGAGAARKGRHDLR